MRLGVKIELFIFTVVFAVVLCFFAKQYAYGKDHVSLQPNRFVLTIEKVGSGSGTVVSQPSGISCGDDCSEAYRKKSTVRLTAAPDSTSVFAGWSGCTVTGPLACSALMTSATTVKAIFELKTPPSPCTYEYGPWGVCTDGMQTRQVTSVGPTGCVGTPVLEQPCTPSPPPPCTYTYSSWSACIEGKQTRNVIDSQPADCAGTPVLEESCILPPPPPYGYVIDDFTFYPIPTIPKPEKGATFQDPVFHTTITRMSDAETEVKGARYSYAFPGYPKHDIENADGTKVLIQSFSGSAWHIYNALPPYNKIKDIPETLIGWGSPIDARWDTTDPDVLYYSYVGKFWKYRVSTDQTDIVYDFAIDFPSREGEQYPVCGQTLQEEGDGSDERRYWAFNIICYDPARAGDPWYSAAYVVMDKDYYSKDKGKIISKILPDSPNWRGAGFVSMSPSGKFVWIGDDHYIYSRDFSTVKALGCSGHADMAISREGREVVVCARTYYGPTGYTDMGQWLMMVDIETAKPTWLAPLGDGAGMFHVSGNSHLKPGWVVVSVYGPTYPNTPDNWAEHSILMIELTDTLVNADLSHHARVWRVAHTHTLRKNYADDPFAKINRKGTKIWFGSGWGNSFADGPYDTYQIDLPGTWYEDLMGSALR